AADLRAPVIGRWSGGRVCALVGRRLACRGAGAVGACRAPSGTRPRTDIRAPVGNDAGVEAGSAGGGCGTGGVGRAPIRARVDPNRVGRTLEGLGKRQ